MARRMSAGSCGLIYFNPADPSFLVETRIGVGWDVNVGNRWGLTLFIFAGLALTARWFGRRSSKDELLHVVFVDRHRKRPVADPDVELTLRHGNGESGTPLKKSCHLIDKVSIELVHRHSG